MDRKTPVHHKVRDHVRAGVHVHRYERGSGKASKLVKVSGTGARKPSYTVVISGSGRTQSLSVSASSITEALNRGIDRTTVEVPERITIRRI